MKRRNFLTVLLGLLPAAFVPSAFAEKRIYTIDVGNLPKEKAKEYLNSLELSKWAYTPESKLPSWAQENLPIPTTLEEAIRQRDTWVDIAMQFHKNENFYRDIITQIGEMFGQAAKTSDDGSIQDSVLALKVPELVQSLIKQNNEFAISLTRSYEQQVNITEEYFQHFRKG